MGIGTAIGSGGTFAAIIAALTNTSEACTKLIEFFK